jgi:hypothetical protein
MFQINLPIGTLITINDHVLRHTGGGIFVSDEPVWLIEGITKDGSDAARAWTALPTHGFTIEIVEDDMGGPSHRRVATGELASRQAAGSNPNLFQGIVGQPAIDGVR